MALNARLQLGEGSTLKSLKAGDSMGDAVDTAIEDVTHQKYVHVEVKAPHAHSFTYGADGAAITATCANTDGGCTDPVASATLAIGAPTLAIYCEEADPAAGLENTSEFNGVTG